MLLALLAASGSGAATRLSGLDGCKLMDGALKAWGGTWPHVLAKRDFEKTVDPPGAYCTWNQATPESGSLAHHLTLTFYVASSPATSAISASSGWCS